MDATRPRRTRDRIRQRWYARRRMVRFARSLGFSQTTPAPQPEGPPCGLPVGSPCPTLNGRVQGVAPLVLTGEVFAHVDHLGVLASFPCASLAWRSSECLCRFPLTYCVG
jgi:hypothetical protein